MAKEYSWYKLEEGRLPFAEKEISVMEVNGKKICCTLHQGSFLRSRINVRMPVALWPMG